MGKKKKAVSQVVIEQSSADDEGPKPENDIKLEEILTTENNTTTSDNVPVVEETQQNLTAENAELNEDTPILSNTEDVVEPKLENDQKVDEVKEESKTIETTTSENSVELKEIQLNPQDEPIKKTKTSCSKGWCMIL